MTTTRDQVTARMAAFASRQPTGTLCESLLALDRKARLDDAERLARAVLIDVLCDRHPEAEAAFQAWADDETTAPTGAVPAITDAAIRAASTQRGTRA